MVLPVEPAPAGFTRTELIYRKKTRNEMEVVSSYVKVFQQVNRYRDAKSSGADVVLVVGPDYHGVLG